MSSRGDQVSEAEANAIQSSHEPTDILDHEKSYYEIPAQVSTVAQAENVEDERDYIVGWRLYLLTFSLCLSLLLSTLETTIVSTSLVSITDALHRFDQSGWVVTSYLLTYTGFLIIYAKFSDIFGRKLMLIIALVLFTVFSIACGLANNMLELIIFRALQGMGGSGIYSMVSVIAPEMVPLQKIGKYMAIITSVFALASVLGPILGGVINSHGSWRWVFLLNAPAGALAMACVVLFLPSHFPYRATESRPRFRQAFTWKTARRLDFTGAFLNLAASILLVFALEEGGSRYPWNNPAIIGTFILSGFMWIAFIGWEGTVGWLSKDVQEAIFPLRLLKDRIFVGLLLNAFFTGFPFMAVIINLPQKFQAVNAASPSAAGFSLLALLLCSPLASALAGLLVTKLGIAPFYFILAGAALQVVGVGLTSSLPTSQDGIAPAQYGYEIIMGFGFGLGLATLLIMVPLVVEKRDMPVAMGAITQIRVLGGTIGLAVCTAVLNEHVRHSLTLALSQQQMTGILQSVSSITDLDTTAEKAVRRVFAEGYNEQMRIMTYFSAVVFIVSLLAWERRPRRVETASEIAQT